ncbi:MAG TPA: Asp23/Gls24 family envelope stress response protein [Clostridiales bacterium]|jgi:uncharacterized alkaline shock family protein YloU|nr:Asp23/Gls24 family envelope stress response protein [Clostridiales bacterium]
MNQDNKYNEQVEKSLVISDEVIATIAAKAAKDIEGVAGLGVRPAVQAYLSLGDSALKSVKVINGDTDVVIHIYIILEGNQKLPKVATEVQQAVKSAVQNMTGKAVTKVDVNISGVEFSKDSEATFC